MPRAVCCTRCGSTKPGCVPVMMLDSGEVEIRMRALASYRGPRSCSKTFTATIPSTIKPTIRGSERRIAAFSASAPPDVMS